MKKNQKFIWLGLIGTLIFATGLLVACSANIPDDIPPTKTGSLENNNQTEDAIENKKEEVDVVSSIDEIFDEAPGSNSSNVALADSEVDAKGVPVGFTENGNPYRGNPNAPVVLEEFSDFQ